MESKEKIVPIVCGVQNYQWGMKGSDSNCLVYKFAAKQHQQYNYQKENTFDENKHYAELWMGIHKQLPSQQLSTKSPLNADDTVSFPFLFKVLSVETALSIQAHPNKQQAEELNKQFPTIYVDDNHKPEFAISLDDFQALSGLAPKDRIVSNVEKNPILIDKLGQELWNDFKNANEELAPQILKQIILTVLSFNEDQLKEICSQLVLPQSDCDIIYDLPNQYPNDVGLIFVLLMNHVRLAPGEALAMDAGVLHAYLKGNCIESMANSDNVVRAGFTPKLKDKQTLSQIMVCQLGQGEKVIPTTIQESDTVVVQNYASKHKEFTCYSIKINGEGKTQPLSNERQSIFICVSGSGTARSSESSFDISEGQTFFAREQQELVFESQQGLVLYLCTSN